MPDAISNLFNGRRFWVSVAGLLFAVLKDRFGVELTDQQMAEILALIGAWVVGDGIRTTATGAIDSKWLPLLQSKRFLAAVAGIITIVANQVAGLGLQEEQVLAITGFIIAWVLGDSYRPAGE